VKGDFIMENQNKKCVKCGSTEFTEATDYMPVKPSKMSLSGSNKIYTFCLKCGEVDSIRIENTTIFKK
jgi:predicted nucleic-acid-binding Zn-ribbon protein